MSGQLNDLFGKKKIMAWSLVAFSIGSLITAISSNGILTIVSRFIQGIGSAILAPISLTLLVDYFKGPQLEKAVSWYSSVAGIGISIGLIIGGVISKYFDWRVGFILNAIIAIGLIILVQITLNVEKCRTTHSCKI